MSALERWNDMDAHGSHDPLIEDVLDAGNDLRDELLAEVERLAWMLHREWQLRTDDHDVGTFDDWLADLAARYDACHFTPSRWQEREA